MLWAVGIIPELRSDEQIFALDHGRNQILERETDFLLVLVDIGEVEVAITVLDCRFNLSNVLLTSSDTVSFCDPLTACATSPGFDCQVPKPIWGMVAPVLSLMDLTADMVILREREYSLGRVFEQC